MKPLTTFVLAALAALMATAFIGASSATAESTVLCQADETTCPKPVTHVHETSVTDALLLNTLGRVKCAVLFLSTSVGAEAAPLVIIGKFTYSSCFRKKLFGSEESCTVTEKNGPSEIKVLKEGHETAKVTGEGEVEVVCGSAIQCLFNGESLIATAKGPLLSTQANGEVTLSGKETHKVSGSFCPSTAELDITTTPLSAIYLPGKMACIKVSNSNTGLYNSAGNGITCESDNKERVGNYELALVLPKLKTGDMACGEVEKSGFFLSEGNREECGGEKDLERLGAFELGTLT